MAFKPIDSQRACTFMELCAPKCNLMTVEWRLQLRDGRLGPKYPLVGGVRTGLNDNPRAEESTSKFSSSLREYF